MAIQAFGIPRFISDGQGRPLQKTPVQSIEELNERMAAMGVTDEQVISIQVDDEFYHVFFRK